MRYEFEKKQKNTIKYHKTLHTKNTKTRTNELRNVWRQICWLIGFWPSIGLKGGWNEPQRVWRGTEKKTKKKVWDNIWQWFGEQEHTIITFIWKRFFHYYLILKIIFCVELGMGLIQVWRWACAWYMNKKKKFNKKKIYLDITKK